MTMTISSMNSFKKANRVDAQPRRLPTSYAALLTEDGVEVEITDAQIRRSLEAAEELQQYPFGARHTARGRWEPRKAPARKLHS